jgi:methylenetetrahydrofolate reductase (NADPH)
MQIASSLRRSEPSFSFEFMPPRSAEEALVLERTIAELLPLEPSFVTVTYGAGGSTRGVALDLVGRVKRETGIEAVAHLTCAGHTRDELRAVLQRLRDDGIENLMALRGDKPFGEERTARLPEAMRYANELITFIRQEGFDFCIGAAAYPEGHVESPNRYEDIADLARKAAAGASFFITQLFFDNAFYFDFLARARQAGITAPIIAGIMPITRLQQVRLFNQHHGVSVPARLATALERCQSPREVREIGVAWATAQCQDLVARGACGIQFFTFNRSQATRRVLGTLRGFAD